MLSLVLAQHTGFILTWTQWQQSLPPWIALECHSISWHRIHYLSEWKGCHTHKPACAAAEGMWWAAVSGQDTVLRTAKLYPARAHGTHRWALCSSALPLLLRKGKCLFWITNEFFTLFTHRVCLQMNSENLASAWNWAFCEVQSAVDRNCFTLWKKPAHVANSYDWDGSSCQADLTGFAMTYVMHYLINNHSGLGPKLGYWYCVKPL